MIFLKILGGLVFLSILGIYVIFKIIERQEALLFISGNKGFKKSKDQEIYDGLNPIWNDK